MHCTHLAVLQCQLKHSRPAANQTNSDAVENHSFTALNRNRGQMVRLHLSKKPPKAVCYCDFRLWLLPNCMEHNKKKKKKYMYIRIRGTFSATQSALNNTLYLFYVFFWFSKRRTWSWGYINIPSNAALCRPLHPLIGLIVL